MIPRPFIQREDPAWWLRASANLEASGVAARRRRVVRLPVQTRCPHCSTLCQVAEPRDGLVVKCGKCGKTFAIKPPASSSSPAAPSSRAASEPAVCRLEIASATTRGLIRGRNEDSFLVQQMSWSNRDQRHEIALVVVPDGMGGY